MQTLRMHTVVPKDRRLEISLPPEVPEGPTEIVIILEPAKDGYQGVASRQAVVESLKRLRDLRGKTAGRNVRLSDAVLEERHAED